MNLYFRKHLLVALVLVICNRFVQAEDLLTIYQTAQCNDPTLVAARETLFSALEAKPQARAGFLPSISATSQQALNHTNIPGTGNYTSNTFNLVLIQPVFYYQQWTDYSKASAQVQQAEANFAAAEQDLILRTSKAYFGVLKAQDGLKYSNELVKAFAKFYHQTNERYKAGLIAITDVEISKARHSNAIALEIAARNEFNTQVEKLKEIIGQDICSLSILRKEIKLVNPDPECIEKWVSSALAQNFSLDAARFAVKVARSNIASQKSGHLPTINIQGNVQHTSSGPIAVNPGGVIPGEPKQTTNSIGLQISMPFFAGGSVNSKVRQAKHDFEKSCAQFEALYRNTESTTRQAFRGILTQTSQITALKEAVKANQSALKATEASFNVGTRTIVDVLNAQSDLIRAEQDYANARYEYIIQSITLKLAAGTLSPEDVQHINGWLQDVDPQCVN
jgi:outer membrane protein